MFTWIPIHRETIQRIVGEPIAQAELLQVLREMEQQGLNVIKLQDEGADGQTTPLKEMDPFTFLASFNRSLTEDKRRENWRFLKTRWGLTAAVPGDFAGIPTITPMASWLFPYAREREKEHVGLLWQIAVQAADRGIASVNAELFDRCLKLKQIGIASLTISLFWINPEEFLPADNKTTAYGKAKGILTVPEDYQSYRRWLKDMTELLGGNYPQVSHAAHLFAVQGKSWGFAKWMGPVLDALRALGGSGTPKLVQQQIQETLKLPDAVLADKNKSGQTKLYNEINWARQYLVWERLIESPTRGQWVLTEKGKQAVLDEQEAQAIAEKWVALHKHSPEQSPGDDGSLHDTAPPSAGVAYWWLNANPKIWNFEETPVSQKETYTSHNETGNKRRVYHYFQAVKPGDLIVGYMTSPQKELVALCKITKGLHQSEDGEAIEFEKVAQLAKPIAYEKLQAIPDLANSEPLTNHQGSLFKLTQQEYEIIRSLIDKTNVPEKPELGPNETSQAEIVELNPEYPLSQCADDTGVQLADLQRWIRAIDRKGQAIFYGPPGTGKTFLAQKLAQHLVGGGNGLRELVQFHPAYAYEDFMQGLRPMRLAGGLDYPLLPGRFLDFCERARKRDGVSVLIIDEINRANLARVFGELMYLLEYRQSDTDGIPLAGGGRFHIPTNVRLIGTMNTADRSIALVDHALRRRFAFLRLVPDYDVLRRFHEREKTTFPVEGLIKQIEQLNGAINDPHYSLGISFFMRKNLAKELPDIWAMEVEPYLEEHFFDQREKFQQFRWEKVSVHLSL